MLNARLSAHITVSPLAIWDFFFIIYAPLFCGQMIFISISAKKKKKPVKIEGSQNGKRKQESMAEDV